MKGQKYIPNMLPRYSVFHPLEHLCQSFTIAFVVENSKASQPLQNQALQRTSSEHLAASLAV